MHMDQNNIAQNKSTQSHKKYLIKNAKVAVT